MERPNAPSAAARDDVLGDVVVAGWMCSPAGDAIRRSGGGAPARSDVGSRWRGPGSSARPARESGSREPPRSPGAVEHVGATATAPLARRRRRRRRRWHRPRTRRSGGSRGGPWRHSPATLARFRPRRPCGRRRRRGPAARRPRLGPAARRASMPLRTTPAAASMTAAASCRSTSLMAAEVTDRPTPRPTSGLCPSTVLDQLEVDVAEVVESPTAAMSRAESERRAGSAAGGGAREGAGVGSTLPEHAGADRLPGSAGEPADGVLPAARRRSLGALVSACGDADAVSETPDENPGDTATFVPATPGTLTVVTSLPGPGFYEGSEIYPRRHRRRLRVRHRGAVAREARPRAPGSPQRAVRRHRGREGGGGYDIALSQISITEARRQVVDFTKPYFESRQSAC